MTFFNGNPQKGSTERPTQLSLWDSPSFDPTDRLKAAMREALKNCPLSRDQVVADINSLASAEGMTCAGRSQEVTSAILDKWVAAGASGHRIPVNYLPIFCRVTGSVLPMQALIAPLGAIVVSGDEAKILRWGQTELERRRLAKESSRLAQEVGLK